MILWVRCLSVHAGAQPYILTTAEQEYAGSEQLAPDQRPPNTTSTLYIDIGTGIPLVLTPELGVCYALFLTGSPLCSGFSPGSGKSVSASFNIGS